MLSLWCRSHWFAKWAIISLAILPVLALAEKAGLWTPDSRPASPPFDLDKCRSELVQKDYPGISFDELAEHIQFEYRQTCSQAALDYQGYVR